MAKVTIHAGDFLAGDHFFNSGILYFERLDGSGEEPIKPSELAEVEIATEQNVKKIGGTLGWGAVGALTLGPVGLLAGLLMGGRKKEVTFVARLKDGRKFMATTDNDTFVKLKAGAF